MEDRIRKAVILLLGFAFIIYFGCAKRSSDVNFEKIIFGNWLGTMTPEGQEAQGILMEFKEDGSLIVQTFPEEEKTYGFFAEGTYKIDNKGNLTGMFAKRGEGVTGKFTGLLEKGIIIGEILLSRGNQKNYCSFEVSETIPISVVFAVDSASRAISYVKGYYAPFTGSPMDENYGRKIGSYIQDIEEDIGKGRWIAYKLGDKWLVKWIAPDETIKYSFYVSVADSVSPATENTAYVFWGP